MPDLTQAQLRRSLIIGYAELVRTQLGASGVWVHASLPDLNRVDWSYATQDGVSPLALVRRRHHVRGYTVIPRNDAPFALSVVWYSFSGADAFAHDEDRVLDEALRRLCWLAHLNLTCDPTVASGIHLRGTADGCNQHSLSPTEHRIYELLRKPLTEVEIAHKLSRSRHTVHVHVKNIYRKLGVNSRRQLLTHRGR